MPRRGGKRAELALPLARAEAVPPRAVPGRLLSLAEARAQMGVAPAEPIEWIGTCRDDGRETRTWALHRKSAVDICAAQFGVPSDRVDCIRAHEQRLSGNGAA